MAPSSPSASADAASASAAAAAHAALVCSGTVRLISGDQWHSVDTRRTVPHCHQILSYYICSHCGEGWRGRYRFLPGRGMGEGYAPSHKFFFHLKGRVLVHFERYFLSVSLPEKCWIFARSGDLVDVEDVLLGNSEHSVRIMEMISFLLHYCIAIWCLKFWNIKKSGGQFALASPIWNSGNSSPVIYAHGNLAVSYRLHRCDNSYFRVHITVLILSKVWTVRVRSIFFWPVMTVLWQAIMLLIQSLIYRIQTGGYQLWLSGWSQLACHQN